MNIDVCFDTETTPTDPITCCNQEPPLPSVLALLLHLPSKFFSVVLHSRIWLEWCKPIQLRTFTCWSHMNSHITSGCAVICSKWFDSSSEFIQVHCYWEIERRCWSSRCLVCLLCLPPSCICLPDCTHLPLCGVVTPSRTWLPSKKSGKLWPLFLPIVDLC